MPENQIPDEIWHIAQKAGSWRGGDQRTEAIARALMARDKRAAEIAQDEQRRRQELYAENGASINAHRAAAAEAIADAILNPSEKSNG